MTRDGKHETLLVRVSDGVATITFHRPEHRNALDPTMATELYAVTSSLADDETVRVVVLTGSGSRFFNPGADLHEASEGRSPDPLDPRILHTSAVLHDMPQVSVAAINGSCAGAGFGWAAACDIRLAADTAKFATAFLDVGLAGDMGLPWSLTRMLGSARTRELMLLRGKFDAAAALEMGLVTAVFPQENFAKEVDSVIERFRLASPAALRTLKLNLVAAERLPFVDYLDLETQRHLALVAAPEFAAGAKAFVS